jgi:hypothetical protein
MLTALTLIRACAPLVAGPVTRQAKLPLVELAFGTTPSVSVYVAPPLRLNSIFT